MLVYDETPRVGANESQGCAGLAAAIRCCWRDDGRDKMAVRILAIRADVKAGPQSGARVAAWQEQHLPTCKSSLLFWAEREACVLAVRPLSGLAGIRVQSRSTYPALGPSIH